MVKVKIMINCNDLNKLSTMEKKLGEKGFKFDTSYDFERKERELDFYKDNKLPTEAKEILERELGKSFLVEK